MTGASILLADDDASVRLVASQALAEAGHRVRATGAFSALLKWVDAGEGDLVVSDVYMPDGRLFDHLRRIKMRRPDLPIIIVSAESTVLTAVEAERHGAFSYLPKPFDLDELVAAVQRALPKRQVVAPPATSPARADGTLIGRSPAMQQVFRLVTKVMDTRLSVLIHGEPGSGRSQVAHAIHELGQRRGTPLVRLAAAELTPDRFDRVVLGAEGAVARATGGTLMLTGTETLSSQSQGLLNAVLARVPPSERPRLLAVSRHNGARLASQAEFDVEFLDQIGAVEIAVPPLRERKEDIPDLLARFVTTATDDGVPARVFERAAIKRLQEHSWPGNATELARVTTRLMLTALCNTVSMADVEAALSGSAAAPMDGEGLNPEMIALVKRHFDAALRSQQETSPTAYDALVGAAERALIELALDVCKGNKVRASAAIGLNRNTLRAKMEQFGLLSPD
jgi:two-component system nitrogen regulation response regulator GlnG